MAKAKLEKSKRLQKLLKVLKKSRGWCDTLYLAKATGSVAVSTNISELRQQGVPVSDALYAGLSKEGNKIFKYRLERK